ncbi:MAG: cytochrome c [Nitrospinota bacterium]
MVKTLSIIILFVLGLIFPMPSFSDPLPGEVLFKNKCKKCHKTTEQLATGPGLKDVTRRRSIEWIDRWLKNPKAVMNSDDPIAQELKKNFKIQMPTYPEMSDDEKRMDIIEYLKTL